MTTSPCTGKRSLPRGVRTCSKQSILFSGAPTSLSHRSLFAPTGRRICPLNFQDANFGALSSPSGFRRRSAPSKGRLFCCTEFDEFRGQNRIETRVTGLRSGFGDDGFDFHPVASARAKTVDFRDRLSCPQHSGMDSKKHFKTC